MENASFIFDSMKIYTKSDNHVKNELDGQYQDVLKLKCFVQGEQ